MGVAVIFYFKLVKAASAYGLHVNLVEHNKSVKGAARQA